MHNEEVLAAELPLELAERLDECSALNVTDGSYRRNYGQMKTDNNTDRQSIIK